MSTQAGSNPSIAGTTRTEAGSYFVSNYPPFSFWEAGHEEWVLDAIRTPPQPDTPLGLYLHIPFCRKRCHFCYFKVYTDKKSSEIRSYTQALQDELTLYTGQPFLEGRTPAFIYFGGGTPSYLSIQQLQELVSGLHSRLSWDQAREIAFECEPGTLSGDKLKVIRELGVTRLSLGVENFDDTILELNGRAHRSTEIFRTFQQARELGFPQINMDLIAGMIGETDDNWHRCIERIIALSPDIVTLYQMEIPFNTTIYKDMKEKDQSIAPVADWDTKRRWVNEGFEALLSAGYQISSAYSAVKKGVQCEFLYRDCLWQGADLLSLGVASFSHIQGVHFQNEKHFEPYLQAVNQGRLPVRRALKISQEERLIREFILQLKKGFIQAQYFSAKYQVDVLDHFADPLRQLKKRGYLQCTQDEVRLTRDGLLRVDSLLPHFYLPQHQGARYT